jgi:hypothetical protein
VIGPGGERLMCLYALKLHDFIGRSGLGIDENFGVLLDKG